MMDSYPQDEQSALVPMTTPTQSDYLWLTPRVIAGILGGAALIGVLFIVGRGSASIPNNETTKVSPPTEEKANPTEINKAILEGQKESFAALKSKTDERIKLDTQWALANRAKEILDYANKQLGTPNSPCFRSPKQHNCTIIPIINEHQIRYADAMAAREWLKANNAQFEIQAARLAADGIVQPEQRFDPSVTRGAVINENEARKLLVEQSDNVIADTLYNSK